MNSPTYQQALEWCNEWMHQNHPDVEKLTESMWGDEFTEWTFRLNPFECPMFLKYSTDSGVDIFDFIIPPTKDDFFTVLRILDK